MRNPVFLHQLDELCNRGCGNPSCTHIHTDELYLIPLCHEGVGLRVDYAEARPDLPCGAVLWLRCRRCQAHVVAIALTAHVPLVPTCRHGRALDVRYQGGQVTVMCRRCSAPHGTADVAPYVPV